MSVILFQDFFYIQHVYSVCTARIQHADGVHVTSLPFCDDVAVY